MNPGHDVRKQPGSRAWNPAGDGWECVRPGPFLLAGLLFLMSAKAAPPAGEEPLGGLTPSVLIDRLQSVGMADVHHPDPGDRAETYLDLGSTGDPGGQGGLLPTRSPELAELVRRGAASIPPLLEHLTDARPTGIVVAFPGPTPAGRDIGPWFVDGYEPRDLTSPGPDGVNTRLRRPIGDPRTYTFKVGDLCYVALGRILDREYRVVESTANDFKPSRAYRGNTLFRGPPPLMYISSPVEVPALAQAARAEWTDLTPEEHRKSLETDADRELGLSEDTALECLFAYYPDSAERWVDAILGVGAADPWRQSTVVDHLKARDWPGLDAELHRLFEAAAENESALTPAQGRDLIPGSVALALACMKHLVHRGYDGELRAFAQKEQSELARRQQEAEPDLIPGSDAWATGMGSAYHYHIDGYAVFLRDLDTGDAPAQPVPLLERDRLAAQANQEYVKRHGTLSGRRDSDDQEAIHALWADRPEVLEAMRVGFREPPRLIAAVKPHPPAGPWSGTGDQTVKISFVIGEKGNVEAARVLDSSDPRFNESALEGVRQWRFEPAQGASGPTRAVTLLPIIFHHPSNPAEVLHLGIGPLMRGRPMSGEPEVFFRVPNLPPGAIRSARVIVTSAEDDTGYRLEAPNNPAFYHPAVGRTSDDVLTRVLDPVIETRLSAPLGPAKGLRIFEGFVEIIVPSLDPNATAVIDHVPAAVGLPVPNAALSGAGVEITLLDRKAHDSAGNFPSELTLVAAEEGARRPANVPFPFPSSLEDQMGDFDYILSIGDPQGRMIGCEFEAADGSPIIYNHNGFWHSQGASGMRSDGFHFEAPLPADARLVVWLITPRSLVTIPFKVHDIPFSP
jgi:TonB family protein